MTESRQQLNETFFRKIPFFADLELEDLQRLASLARRVTLEPGEILFEERSPGDHAYLITRGTLEVVKMSQKREVLLSVLESGQVVGELALLEDRPRMATVRARTSAELWGLNKAQLENLLRSSPSAAETMFQTMLQRWRNTTSKLRQSEKMAQLGTMAAGIAHELNNPSAAVARAAQQLETALNEMGDRFVDLLQLGTGPAERATVERLTEQARQRALAPAHLDAISRSDLEFALEEWLEEKGVEDAWKMAPTMAHLDLAEGDKAILASCFEGKALATVIGWLNANYETYSLMTEMRQGAGRISNIVKALKSYSYLDQAPMQQVDVHKGLDDTLLILRHKIKQGVTVHRDYADDLPRIEGYGSELNQVWTNLLDNAIDAVLGVLGTKPEGPPEIWVKTRQENKDWISVEIVDNGPGIPGEVQNRLFEPFFTTKPIGAGTGLGLDISWNIVVNKHRGEIRVGSKPGRTSFAVWLPINFEA